MTDHWNFYPLRVDDKPASIFVDMGARDFAPVTDLPFMAYIRLRMNHPRPDGLSSKDEYPKLIAVEDYIVPALSAEGAAFVGRCTTNGCRDFYFYISAADGWESKASAALERFQDYEFASGARPDATWRTYFDFLYPSEVDRQRISNRNVCEALEKDGDKLVKARDIDHWCYFPDAPTAQAFTTEAIKLGFSVRDNYTVDKSDLQHCVQLWRSDIPSYDNINAVTLPLFEAALKLGGKYDGWECQVDA